MRDSGDSKLKRDKRRGSEMEDGSERRGQVKMRDLKYVMALEAKTSKTSVDKEALSHDQEMSKVTGEPVAVSSHGGLPTEPEAVPDLNAEPCNGTDIDSDFYHDVVPLLRKHQKCEDVNYSGSTGLNLDLNTENALVQNQFHPSKKLADRAKLKDISECSSSTTGPLEGKEKDPLMIWKEMKQNGFLSSSHGGIPAPKQRGRKSKTELSKKRLELVRKERADKFAKLAAPIGLLNDLNPGIINHVRNRRQVHSIIEALVKSEKPLSAQSRSRQGTHLRNGSKEAFGDSGANWQKMQYPNSFDKSNKYAQYSIGSDMVQRMFNASLGAQINPFNHNDSLALKLSAPMGKALELSMFNDGLTNVTGAMSLSVKAATIASHWLELLHQDIRGRLAAIKRSKRRVQSVISTELPFLIAKEFSSDQENNPFAGQFDAVADAHRARWNALFGQMDKALSEEEQQLEVWLNQVREMRMHSEHGLQSVSQFNASHGLHNPGSTENMLRSGMSDDSEGELAVRAAAASIYSTCNFLLSKGDVSCF